MDLEDGLTALDKIVTQFNTYENYLDSQITDEDLYYLEDEDLARQLVELGGRGTGKVVKRGDFEARKATIMAIRRAAIEAAKLAERTQKKTLTSTSKELQDNFLKALAVREEDNRNGKVSSVIFIRDRNSHGQQVSAYIDYAHRLKTEDFEPYFNGKKRLVPRPTDLSFYNWNSNTAMCNSTPNYQVIADNPEGLVFKYKRDSKILNVDPKALPGDDSTRTSIDTELYIQAVIFDHIFRG
ncbi:cilia and flagella associated protein 299 [Phyllostomus discolor]|uniref:Cilia- and flagella-associated protein 299 n=1 Tax=Phyllostomus discolor TaxID=89673 RepID=A0A7E6DHA0_9CHIR|nr:cilia- and flagella-associated protein 299 isoform X1 [Phyllostomus discolor]KAF6129319.1 cilia and flagella associated protein 299 [Phyllostomus discolor]